MKGAKGFFATSRFSILAMVYVASAMFSIIASASFFVWGAFIEEFVKFGAAYFAVHKSASFDEPIDAMIYMVAAALGFATIESLGAVGDSVSNGQTALLANLLTTTSLRFVGATLLHSLASGIVGYHWADGIRRLKPAKYILEGPAIATVLHATFNYLIIKNGPTGLAILFLMFVAFFVLNDFEKLKKAA